MARGSHGIHRPRPVAGVPPDLPAAAVDVARDWLIELIAAVPLAEAGAVPVADLAADGPALCAALLRAVGSDAELDRLAPGGDLEPLAVGAARLAGARDTAAAARAVARLRAALWRVLCADVPRDDAAWAIALAERVAHIADVVTAAALAPPVDAALRDAEEPWAEMVRRAVEVHARDGAPFSVLVVEADDADRLVAAGGTEAAAMEHVEAAVRGAVRPGDPVARERPGRLWIVAPGLDAAGARALAERLTSAAAQAGAPHGAPLTAAAGIATSPDDGGSATALGELADERLFAARAAGVPVA
jgi:GGDEF domain-containing protein